MITGGVWFDQGQLVAKGWTRIPRKYESATQVKLPKTKKWVENTLAIDKHEFSKLTPAPNEYPDVQKPSLLILGPPGTGKTYEAIAAVRELIAGGFRGHLVYTPVSDFYATMRATKANEETYKQYERAGALLLDDYGTTNDTKSDWMTDLMVRLFEYRYNFELPTVMVVNAKPAEIEPLFGERMTSRFREMCLVDVMTGEDRRK